MNTLTVSVIIPTFGREQVLCQTLQQVMNQVRPPDEILVIDQTPAHEPKTEHFLSQMETQGKMRLIRQEAPSASRARNKGILEATGDILIFLDDDVLIAPDFVSAHVNNFQDPAVAAVTGAIWSENGITLPLFHEIPLRALKEPLGWMEVPPSLAFRTEKILLLAGNCSVRRSIARQVGGFDENFGRYDYHADYDFGWRLHRAGCTIIHDPGAGIHHLVAPRGGCRVARQRKPVPEIEELRPKFYFYLKNFPGHHSLAPLVKLLRQQVLNRANVVNPPCIFFSLSHALAAFIKASCDVVFTGERSLIQTSTFPPMPVTTMFIFCHLLVAVAFP